MHEIPPEDRETYEMLCHADSMGVFQVESRAQMAMLPRLQPRKYYDLVVEVALVRPGPIQGDMVHPYLAATGKTEHDRENFRPVDAVLAPHLRRADLPGTGHATGRRRRRLHARRGRPVAPGDGRLAEQGRPRALSGQAARRHERRTACRPISSERIIAQIQGFGEYGFPESHAASFALLVYASAWLKRHHPAAFLCGLLNSQPMGFYSPSMLVQDARRHGRRPCCRRTSRPATGTAASMKPVPCASACARSTGFQGRWPSVLRLTGKKRPFSSVADLAARAGLARRDLDLLAAADALQSLAGHRRQAAWSASVENVAVQGELFAGLPTREAVVNLAAPGEGENLVADYRSLGLTLRRHPLTLLRQHLAERRFIPAAALRASGDRALIRAAGIVVGRQRPGTATGIVFVTLEDESGLTNVVVQPWLVEKQRRELLGATLLGVYGQLQVEGEVVHLVARRLVDLSAWLGRLETSSRDFH